MNLLHLPEYPGNLQENVVMKAAGKLSPDRI